MRNLHRPFAVSPLKSVSILFAGASHLVLLNEFALQLPDYSYNPADSYPHHQNLVRTQQRLPVTRSVLLLNGRNVVIGYRVDRTRRRDMLGVRAHA